MSGNEQSSEQRNDDELPALSGAELLSDRSQKLLTFLVQRFIQDGQPVGSKTLATESGLALSPATIRNVMADLEEHGFIQSPHTSAGRIPTQQGYRFFVNRLMMARSLVNVSLQDLQQQLDPNLSQTELVEKTSNLLSSLTSQAGIVTVPRREDTELRQLEFLPLSGTRVLVILVDSDAEVHNRIIHTQRSFSANELRQAAMVINRRFAGQRISQVKLQIVNAMADDRDNITRLLNMTVTELSGMVEQVFDTEQQDDCVVAGQSRLLDSAHGPDQMLRLRELFDAFQHKKDLLHLMDSCANASGVQIFIGQESGYDMLGDYSLITAPYQRKGESVGVLGVIGPTRMAYQQVIPIVDVTARLLSGVLDQKK